MDSLTQIVLGAAVGEAVLGKKAGNKAMVWGAIAGTIPDLDVLSGYFLSDFDSLLFHRGITHSILFAILSAPVLAYFVNKIHSKSDPTFRDWLNLFFWCVFIHPLLDIFTNYGTQLFYPFSDYRVAFNTIFVIDLLYTLPLLIGCILVFRQKDTYKRWKINRLSLVLSTAYLILTCINKWYIEEKVLEKIKNQNIAYFDFMTTPAPFTNILWSVIIKEEDQFRVGYYSWFDGSDSLHLTSIRRKEELLQDFLPSEKVEQLIIFSKGFYELENTSNGLIFNDLRFSTISGWFNVDDAYIFSFRLEKENDDVSIFRIEPEGRLNKENFIKLLSRITGNNLQINGK